MENEILLIIGSVLETMGHEHTTFFENHWVQALYGWVGYNLYVLIKAKKEFDTDGSGYLSWKEIKYYFKVELLPLIFSVWAIPVGVLGMPFIWVKAFPGTELFEYSYILAGPTAGFIQWYIKKKFNGK